MAHKSPLEIIRLFVAGRALRWRWELAPCLALNAPAVEREVADFRLTTKQADWLCGVARADAIAIHDPDAGIYYHVTQTHGGPGYVLAIRGERECGCTVGDYCSR